MKVICRKCQGNKTYRGMGSMIVKCDACKGIGLVEPEIKPDASEPVKAKAAKKVIKGKSDAKEKTGQESGS